MNRSKRSVSLALGCFVLACPAFLPAQQDQESVADAARKAQAARKSSPPPKLVVDNDSLGSLKGTINVVGETPSPEKADDQTKSKGAAKDEAYWRGKFAEAYKKLADDSKELDITQREHNLNQEQYYANPMATLQQEYSRKDLNDQKSKIDDLTARVAQDKTNISNLEDELRQSGGEPGWANQPSQSSQTENSSGSSQPAAPATPAPSAQPASGAAPASGSSSQ
jgi:hypothetical protein